MESNNELKETDTKNYTCYYFGSITEIEQFDFDKTLLDKKPYKNILVNDIS